MLHRPHVALAAAAALSIALPPLDTNSSGPTVNAAASRAMTSDAITSAAARLAALPVRFEANAGQWDEGVRFVAHRAAETLFITDDEMTLGLGNGAFVSLALAGAQPSKPQGELRLATKSNFFLGNDRTRWRAGVPNFGQVRARGWRPGVDVVWHGGAGGIEYDLVVAAGTDASELAFEVRGAASLRVRDDGALEIATAAGTLVEAPPRVLQQRRELRTRYRIDGTTRVAFDIEGYDQRSDILIDPTLVYSTYLGASANGTGIAVDAAGNIYAVGETRARPPFPPRTPISRPARAAAASGPTPSSRNSTRLTTRSSTRLISEAAGSIRPLASRSMQPATSTWWGRPDRGTSRRRTPFRPPTGGTATCSSRSSTRMARRSCIRPTSAERATTRHPASRSTARAPPT